MKLVVGLGNPGEKYAKTRHNLGFLVVDQLAQKLKINDKWKLDEKTNSAFIVHNSEFLLVKPQTFVNQSGDAVGRIAKFYKIKPENILIIRDDIDLSAGTVRGPKTETGSGGHLGIESIVDNLKTNKFYQLKIGVGRPAENLDPAGFVLEKMSEKKWRDFKNLIETEAIIKIQNWIDG